MLNIWGNCQGQYCDRISRRDFLRVGGLGLAGLSLADVLRLRAQEANRAPSSPKSVIMIVLPGGPPHIDMYDMKPDAPVEVRGEFKPIKTNVPGMEICELLPLQAKIADKLTIIRGLKTHPHHNAYELLTGHPASQTVTIRETAPSFGSVVSKLRGDRTGAVPPYVSLNTQKLVPSQDDPEIPGYLGLAHGYFRPEGPGLENLRLAKGMSLDRLEERKALLSSFDQMRRDVDASRSLDAHDAFTRRALEIVTSGAVYKAFDLSKEEPRLLDRYGKAANFLMARRLVEAGVPVVTATYAVPEHVPEMPKKYNPVVYHWDHHVVCCAALRAKLPRFDRAVHTLITDLCERGLDQEVAVVIWGEFGRSPKISSEGGEFAGRGHWPEAGFALLAGGGGLRMGQVVGETDRHGARAKGRPFTAPNVLATLYHVLGIDPNATIPDFSGRPQHLLADPTPIKELM